MKSSRKIRIGFVTFFFVSLLLGFWGYALMFPGYFGLASLSTCMEAPWGEIVCLSDYGLLVGKPLYLGALYITPVFLVIALLPKTYQAWKWFGVWALPLLIVFVKITPVIGDPVTLLPSRSLVAARLSQVFLVISTIIIAYSWWQNRKSKK